MKPQIQQVTRQQVIQLISEQGKITEEELQLFQRCLLTTTKLWVGMVDGVLVCVWGLIPPTLFLDQAYLWLYTTEAVKDHEFIFVRHSQRAVEEMLKEFPTIIGHVKAGEDRSIRWLKWLGAEYSEPAGKLIPFIIRGKNG